MKFWKRGKTLFKNADMFGHEIRFNFQGGDHDKYNTYTGAKLSVCIKAFLLFYVYMCFRRLIVRDDDDMVTVIGAKSFEELGTVKY